MLFVLVNAGVAMCDEPLLVTRHQEAHAAAVHYCRHKIRGGSLVPDLF